MKRFKIISTYKEYKALYSAYKKMSFRILRPKVFNLSRFNGNTLFIDGENYLATKNLDNINFVQYVFVLLMLHYLAVVFYYKTLSKQINLNIFNRKISIASIRTEPDGASIGNRSNK